MFLFSADTALPVPFSIPRWGIAVHNRCTRLHRRSPDGGGYALCKRYIRHHAPSRRMGKRRRPFRAVHCSRSSNGVRDRRIGCTQAFHLGRTATHTVGMGLFVLAILAFLRARVHSKLRPSLCPSTQSIPHILGTTCFPPSFDITLGLPVIVWPLYDTNAKLIYWVLTQRSPT